jgi:hypothetical protein
LAWCTLGRDFNGVTLYSDRKAWLEANVNEPGEREAFEMFLSTLESTESEVREILRKED